MFEPIPIAFARQQELFQTGVQAVEGVSARVARERAAPTADEGHHRPTAQAPAGGNPSGVVFIGQAPSLSTGVLGVFGELDETRLGGDTAVSGQAEDASTGAGAPTVDGQGTGLDDLAEQGPQPVPVTDGGATVPEDTNPFAVAAAAYSAANGLTQRFGGLA